MSANVFIRSALSTCTLAAAVDPAVGGKRLRASLVLALADLPSTPPHFESGIWAFRKGLTYEGRADQYTLAMPAKPAYP